MNKVDEEMKLSMKTLTKEGIFNYAKMEHRKWLFKYLGMIVLSGVKIWWTWKVEDAFRKVREGNKYALKTESEK